MPTPLDAPDDTMAPTEEAPVEDTRPTELRGVRMARAGALASFIGLVLILISPILIFFTLAVHLPLVGETRGSGSLTIALLEELVALVAVGALLTLISMVLYIIAFSTLRKVHDGFGGPMVLSIIGVIGMLLITLGVALVLVTILQAVGCVASGAASSCLSVADLVTGVYAVLGGLLLAFIGWIGLLIGVYRIGKRYDSTLTKVGAILYIIPFLSVIAPLLVLIGIQGIVHRLEQSATAPA